MTPSLKFRALALIPFSIALFLLLLYGVPKRVSGLGNVMPLLHLLPVYVWGLLYARDMPYVAVAVIGLLADIVMGLPIGLSGLLYCLFYAVLQAQRKYIYKEGFVVAWGYFALLLFVLQLAFVLVLLMLSGTFYSVQHAMIQWALTATLYPFAHHIFYRMAERMAKLRYRWTHG